MAKLREVPYLYSRLPQPLEQTLIVRTRYYHRAEQNSDGVVIIVQEPDSARAPTLLLSVRSGATLDEAAALADQMNRLELTLVSDVSGPAQLDVPNPGVV